MGNNSIYKDARLLSKYISLTIVVILLLLFLLLFVIGIIVIGINNRPVNQDSNEQIIVQVEPGSNTETISEELSKKNIIRNATIFKYYLKLNNISSFQAGEYKFSPSMSPKDIAISLESGKVYLKTALQIEIKAESSIELIAGTIEEETSITREEFLKKMKDRSYIKQIQKKYPKMITDEVMQQGIRYPLEGYLAAGKYQFSKKDVSIDEIVETMLKETYDTTYNIYKNNGAFKLTRNYQEEEISFHEFLSLSSLVESEMMNVTDKSRYVSLIINRIENNPQSALNSDKSVKYALNKEPNENLSEHDYKDDSKYNTYVHKGLPIGPICNISEETARITINPPDTDYYYYTHSKSGKIIFADTLKEQEKNREN
ncbi:endolytic transglycosylase MltG [Mammaliicoccus stepanovicii]|uniref:Endolytic murein transglycosylase n=1 Tax=Mammaliicoccus stepanovicii TaxID=643214 RepID=A0A239Z568_9STAP|nr:endolytic transglycosylase MltG [Mammaliicoccus stepanovicii]PNZ72415.1 endolytic transglycosylase MltG [Mammaliicoccus stepanovicii]GGI40165.1 hypothetical protein GCM10010896_07010 [Mammaliicoccus stepanovicii]SNV65674.1 putative aminodeoxychorismate lyase [Mammaliicoccus stepanovicii]